MPARLSHTVLRPQECVVAFGVPTSLADFKHDRDRGVKDFVKRFDGIPRRYSREFLAPMQRLASTAKPLGVTIKHQVTLAEFATLLARPEFRVVILVTHSYEGHVEFFEGPATIADVVACIPPAFDGVLDLTSCCHDERTWQLPIAIRGERPKCLVRFIRRPVTPGIWFGFHAAFFRELATGQSDYFDALRKVAESFVEVHTMTGRKTVRGVFEEYLREIQCLPPVTLGPQAAARVNQQTNARLAAALEDKLRSNQYVITVYLSMLGGGLILAAILALRHPSSAWNVGLVAASSFAMVAGILEKVRKLWWQKNLLDITVVLIRELPPLEAAKVIETLYWNMLVGSTRERDGTPRVAALGK